MAEETEAPSTVRIVESASTTRIVLAPETLETGIDSMSAMTEPKSVETSFVSPGRLPPRRRRSSGSSRRTLTAQGAGYGP